MSTVIIRSILGLPISAKLFEADLLDICEATHSSCNEDCPVFLINGCEVSDSANDFKVNHGCDCFKDGNTCGAGAGSIAQKRYHGFLRNGYLED